ncbi:MAG: S8 family serine peptidase [Gammaproteobacteria bacterium]|nr:S8 family serine peptidase [Gammaproteobacteria bacterium]
MSNPALNPRRRRAGLLLAALLCPLLACPSALARDGREVREVRESREARDSREAAGKADRERSRDSERSSGGGSGGSGSGGSQPREADSGGSTATSTSGSTTTRSSGGDKRDADKARADAAKDEAKRNEDANKDAADAAEQAAKDAEDAAKDAADAAEDEAKDAEREHIDLVADDRVRSGEPLSVEHGLDGRERIVGEVLMIDRSAAVARVRAAGYSLRSERVLPATGETMARVQLRAGQSVEQALRQLQGIAPQGIFAPNHVFRPSQLNPGRDAARPIAPALPASDSRQPFSVGIIDTGADLAAAPIAAAVSRSRGFVGSDYLPRGHGTLVAEIAAAGGARLALADVFGADADQRLVAPADAIAAAIAWLIDERAEVINISIEGPDNPVMGLMVRRALSAGIVIVAAAGNGGPAAPPAYPAAYPGVIAVTAIDGQDHVYRRANRGPYISFAAPGVNVVSSAGSFGGQPVSGTSFAAPAVTATIARDLQSASRPAAVIGAGSQDVSAVLNRLRAAARDLGPAGFDPVYGWGAVSVALPGPNSGLR